MIFFCFSVLLHINHITTRKVGKTMKDKFSEWLQKIQRVHPKADEEVLRFIYDFSTKQGCGEAEEVLYSGESEFQKIEVFRMHAESSI